MPLQIHLLLHVGPCDLQAQSKHMIPLGTSAVLAHRLLIMRRRESMAEPVHMVVKPAAVRFQPRVRVEHLGGARLIHLVAKANCHTGHGNNGKLRRLVLVTAQPSRWYRSPAGVKT